MFWIWPIFLWHIIEQLKLPVKLGRLIRGFIGHAAVYTKKHETHGLYCRHAVQKLSICSCHIFPIFAHDIQPQADRYMWQNVYRLHFYVTREVCGQIEDTRYIYGIAKFIYFHKKPYRLKPAATHSYHISNRFFVPNSNMKIFLSHSNKSVFTLLPGKNDESSTFTFC